MSDIVALEMLSAEYGWTPSEIRKESFSDIAKYISIIGERRRQENKRMKQ